MKNLQRFWAALSIGVIFPSWVMAASIDNTISNFVTAIIGRIFPAIALYYLAENILGHIRKDPNAKKDTPAVVGGCVCLLAINAVWSFIQSSAR